jgi:glucosamine kinase
MADQLFLGIDAGGSHCSARLVSGSGAMLGEAEGGPASGRLGAERQIAVLDDLARRTCGAIPLSQVHAGIGVAGLSRPGIEPALAANPFGFAGLQLASDAMIACLGAHGGADGGVVILGTGSMALARVKGKVHKAGGFGFPAGDEGAGAAIGLAAVRESLKTFDGRQQTTAMVLDVLSRIGLGLPQAIAWTSHAMPADFAALAPAVFECAHEGDPLARQILCEAGDDVAGLVRALQIVGAPRLSILGGISGPIRPWLPPRTAAALSEPLDDQVAGAILLARQAPG